MMQSTGRVLGANHVFSAALRASPLVCALDTVMMIVEFVCLMNVGCPISTAARHVWYGRFERGITQSTLDLPLASIRDNQSNSVLSNSGVPVDDNIPEDTGMPNEISNHDTITPATGSRAVEVSSRPSTPILDLQMTNSNYLAGSSIDRNWRQSMFAFAIGVAPQALKVFAMRGTPLTQVLMSIYIIAFLVPELFRLIAGSAGEIDLRPMPIVVRTRRTIVEVANVLCGFVAMAPVFPANILLFYLHTSLASQVAMWFYLGPINVLHMFMSSVQLSMCISEAHSHTSPLTRVMQLWAVDFLAFNRKLFCTPKQVVTLVVLNPLLDSEPFLTGLCLHLALLVIAHLVLPPLLLHGHISPDAQFPETFMTYYFMSGMLLIFVVFAIPLMSLLLYGVLFVSLSSKIPRRLTGVKGSMGELLVGYVTLCSLFTAFYMYSQLWTSEGTYKPAWADYLG